MHFSNMRRRCFLLKQEFRALNINDVAIELQCKVFGSKTKSIGIFVMMIDSVNATRCVKKCKCCGLSNCLVL
jgi:hypothetical protein